MQRAKHYRYHSTNSGGILFYDDATDIIMLRYAQGGWWSWRTGLTSDPAETFVEAVRCGRG